MRDERHLQAGALPPCRPGDISRGGFRTLLGGYLPAADIGVWNPRFQVGYEVMVIFLPARMCIRSGRVDHRSDQI